MCKLTEPSLYLVATAYIAPETVLFTIPRNSVICSSTSQLPQEIPQLFDLHAAVDGADDDMAEAGEDSTDSPPQDSWTSLILIMMYEHLRGPASRWKPYLDVLPSAFNTPMFWSDQELTELQASPVVDKVGRDSAHEMIRSKILPVIKAHASVFFAEGVQKLGDEDLEQLAYRMGSTIMAYAFDLEREDDEEPEDEDEWVEDREGLTMMGMVPMADTLNADAEFNAHVDHGEEFLTVTAIRAINKGEEVLNYYGPLSSGELLRRYGYVTPKHARYDLIDLPWDSVLQSLREELALSERDWAKIEGMVDDEDQEDYFVIDYGADEPDSSGQVGGSAAEATCKFPDELWDQTKSFLKNVKKISPEVLQDKTRRDEIMYSAVLRALERRASQYATTLEQDRAVSRGGHMDERVRMALDVRMGEKMLLSQASVAMRERLGKVASQGSDPEAPPAKRRRT